MARCPSRGAPGHTCIRGRSSPRHERAPGRMTQNGPMLMGNKKAQRITVGVIIGVMVVSLALSLISSASATP